MARRKTNEEFIKEVYELVGDEYEFLEEYKNASTKIKCKHSICEHEWYTTPNNFLRGTRCPICNVGGKGKLIYNNIKHYIEIESNSGCILISKNYNGYDEILQIKCKCGNKFYASWNAFQSKNKRQCNECGLNASRNSRTLSHEEVKRFIETESDSECKLLSKEYHGIREDLRIECKCGNVFQTSFDKFKNRDKRQCNECSKKLFSLKMSKTQKEFEQEILSMVGSEYNVIGKYINAKTKVKMKHITCGHIFDTYPNNFLRGGGCPACSKIPNYNRDTKQFIQEVYSLVKDEYNVLGNYKGIHDKILIRHNECGYVWKVSPNSFLNKESRCPRCAGVLKKTTKQFEQEVYNLVGNEYKILDEYVNARKKIKIKHNRCNYEYYVKPSNFLNGKRCPQCSSSKGEDVISTILNINKIRYIREYRYDDCRNQKPLPFDFYLPKYNLLIEYDGEQHYQSVNFGGISDDKALLLHRRTKRHDKIKNKYCKDNSIPLLRIPYWEFDNIEQILEEWLVKHGALQKDKDIA